MLYGDDACVGACLGASCVDSRGEEKEANEADPVKFGWDM